MTARPRHADSPSVFVPGPVSPLLARCVLAASLLCIFWQIYDWAIGRADAAQGRDFLKHWLAARALLDGASVYHGWELHLGFNYPQWTAFVYYWLGLLQADDAWRVWRVFNLGLLAGCWLIAWRGMRPQLKSNASSYAAAVVHRWGIVCGLAIVLYLPAVTCLADGNVDPYNAILSLALIAALLGGSDAVAGLLWMLLILCKLLPLSLALVFVLWNRRRVLAGAGAAFLGYVFLLLITDRSGYELYFFRYVIPEISDRWRDVSISLPLGLVALTGTNPWSLPIAAHHWITNGILAALGSAAAAAAGWMRWRRVAFERALEPALLWMPLLSPLVEYHHFVFCLPVLFLQLRRWAGGAMGRGWATFFAAGWIALGQSHALLDLWPSYPPIAAFIPVFAAAGMIAGCLAEIALSPKSASVETN